MKYFNSINQKSNNQEIEFNKPTIIVFSMIDYYFRIQRTQHLSRILAERGYQVFYIGTKINNQEVTTNKIIENLYETNLYCNTDRNISVYKSVLNQNEIFSLKKSIEDLKVKFNFQHYISFITNPFWYQVSKHLLSPTIFDCIDYTKGFNTHPKILLDLEDEALKTEYCIFTSPVLMKMMNYTNPQYKIIRNGCEYKYFNSIKSNKQERPIIGYFGCISDWFDADLLNYVISKLSHFDFHFIGAVWCQDKNHETKIKNLGDYSNVTFFGEIPYKDLHKYVY